LWNCFTPGHGQRNKPIISEQHISLTPKFNCFIVIIARNYCSSLSSEYLYILFKKICSINIHNESYCQHIYLFKYYYTVSIFYFFFIVIIRTIHGWLLNYWIWNVATTRCWCYNKLMTYCVQKFPNTIKTLYILRKMFNFIVVWFYLKYIVCWKFSSL